MISFDFTEALKSKSFYMMRKKIAAITPDNIRSVLTIGDISPTTFGQLSSFLNEVGLVQIRGCNNSHNKLFNRIGI